MKTFWEDAYDDAKDRRYGVLFIAALLISLAALTIFAIIGALMNSPYAGDAAPALVVCIITLAVALVCAIANWIRGRKQREEALKFSMLSRDELAKARSKLKTRMQPVRFRRESRLPRRPSPRRPDTDLKY